MARFKCNTCGGEYNDVGKDGVRYFHACAGEIFVTSKAADETVATVPLRSLAGAVLVADDKARDEEIAKGTAPGRIFVELAREERPRFDGRDENPAPGDLPKGVKDRPIVAEGRGVTKIG